MTFSYIFFLLSIVEHFPCIVCLFFVRNTAHHIHWPLTNHIQSSRSVVSSFELHFKSNCAILDIDHSDDTRIADAPFAVR